MWIIEVCTPSLDEVPWVNSRTLISYQKSLVMIRINPSGCSFCQPSTLVISMWKNCRGAERNENRKENCPLDYPFTKECECRSIPAKPTGIKIGKDTTASFEH